MKLSHGGDDGNGNVIARVAWINKDLTVDHYTTFNLGPQAENFGISLSDNYLDFSHFDDSKFNAIKVEGVEPKSANVTDDSFKIWATEHMYCAKDADDATKAFLEFMLSDDVQGKLVEEQGFIPVSAMKDVKDASGKVSAK